MKGLNEIAELSRGIVSSIAATWLPVYYSFETDTVYSSDGKGRFKVCDLINPNTAEEIKSAVIRWKMM